MPSIADIVRRLEQRLDGMRIADAQLLERANVVHRWDDGIVPVVVLGPPASTEDIRRLRTRLEETSPWPDELEELLRLHDGIIACGVTEDRVGDADDAFDDHGNAILSVARIEEDLDGIFGELAGESVPRGLLAFHMHDQAEDLLGRTVFASGRVVLVDPKGLPAHRDPTDLASYEVTAPSLSAWLDAWIESGFAPRPEVRAAPSTPARAIERFAAGDIVRLDGQGFYWVVATTDVAYTQWLDLQRFASEDGPTRFASLGAMGAQAMYCEKVQPSLRARLEAIIPPDILARLPGTR